MLGIDCHPLIRVDRDVRETFTSHTARISWPSPDEQDLLALRRGQAQLSSCSISTRPVVTDLRLLVGLMTKFAADSSPPNAARLPQANRAKAAPILIGKTEGGSSVIQNAVVRA